MKEINLFWDRRPGKFVNKMTGESIELRLPEGISGPAFTGSVKEWYETLVETLIDLRNQLHRGTKRSAREINVYVSPDVNCILASTVLYKPAENNQQREAELVGMNIIVSRSVERFVIEMEYKTGLNTERGTVTILEE